MLFYHGFPTVVKGGYFGVLIFFVLSGYLCAYKADDLFPDGHFRPFRYYKKRFLRIYPGLVLVLLASLGALALIDPNRMANSQKEVLSIVLGYNNYWQIGMQADYFANLANTSPFTHLWYIAILIQFDLLWPFIALVYQTVRRHSSRINAILLITVLTLLSYTVLPICMLLSKEINITAIYYGTHTRLFSLMTGVLLGFLHKENMHIRPLRFGHAAVTRIVYLLFLAATIAISFLVPGTNMFVYYPGMQLYTIAVALLIEILCLNRRHLLHFLDDRLSDLVSRYSYEIYLWQYPVFFLTGILFPKGLPLLGLLQIVLIVLLSIWSHAFVSLARKK